MRRLNRSREMDDSGVEGIAGATLLVPIIAVAAIAAGVFMDTSNELKGEAEKTVDTALAEVTTRINVRSIYGVRENDRYIITQLHLYMGLGPGCPPQNLTDLVIDIDDGESIATLRYHDGPADPEHYNVTPLIDPDDRFSREDPIVYPGTTVEICIDLCSTELKLKTDTTCSIQFIPKQGSPTVETFTTPAVYSSGIIHFW